MAHPIRHFRTITAHRHLVIRHCRRAGIFWQGLLHDLSKYSPAEFAVGARFYTDGTRSPNEAERQSYGYSKAWLHHKGRNRHHFEYWTDYDPVTKRIRPLPMPDRYIIEMACDRIAASKIYMKDAYTDASPLAYYLRGKPTRFIEEETAKKLEDILTMLAEKGEDATFAFLRRAAKYGFSQKERAK